MARQLKVFSTAAGFVNAIIAAPSQKAALEAWGVRDNLFASGAATVVTDPDLIAQALAKPGEIVRVPISTDAGFLAAAKPVAGGVKAKAAEPAARPARKKSATKKAAPPPPPPPDRSPLTRAEKAVSEAEERRRAALADLDNERVAYERRRSEVEKKLNDEVARAECARDAALKAFKVADVSP